MFRARTFRHITAALAVALVPFAGTATAHAKVVKAANPGDGIVAAQTGQCSDPSIDAKTSASWTWTKPMMEVSADNGTTWNSAASYSFTGGKQFDAMLCRSSTSYWFQVVLRSTQSANLGADVVAAGLQFKMTIPLKTGDTALRMTGYSAVISYTEASSVVTVITKASPLSKINFGNGWSDFVSRHSECSAYTMETWKQCSITKADQDLDGAVIQHVNYTASAPSTWQTATKGVWVGANVNGYDLSIDCANTGTDSSSGSYGGGTYSGSDNGANKPASSSTTAPSLSVSMTGTPHLKYSGATNEGDMQAFVPEAIARKCFGDGTETIPLTTIAANMNVSRTEKNENGGAEQALTTGSQYTAAAVTSPVAGLLISVAKMSFSNPTYKASSKLAQQLLASYTASSGAAANSTAGTTVSMKAKVKGTKVTLTITLGAAQTVKVYKKVGTKQTLVKSLAGKVGANTVVTPHKKGATYIVKSASGTVLKSLKP